MPTDERIEAAREKAHQYDKNYGGCAQSVLGALQEALGIGSVDSFKAATMLAGGIAKQGETCGALVGALCAIGLVVGREKIEDSKVSGRAMSEAVEVSDRFRDEMQRQFGLKEDLQSNLCRDIQRLILGRPFDLRVEYRAFVEAGGLSDTGCPKVCGVAAQMAAEEIIKRLEETRSGPQ